jgi:hypothetical protein
MLETEAVSTSAKATDLSSDFGFLYLATRTSTDIRPIFDQGAGHIVGATIIQMMTIDYISSTGQEGAVSFAMDIKDIEQLAMTCRRAIEKAKKSHALIVDCIKDVIVPGLDANN